MKDRIEYRDATAMHLGCALCGQAAEPGHRCAQMMEAEKSRKERVNDENEGTGAQKTQEPSG